MVRQSFSHGRSKQVVVEKVKRRIVGGPAEAKAEPAPRVETPKAAGRRNSQAPRRAAAPRASAKPKPSGVVLRTLTEEERNARAHALADSRVREAEERKIAEEEARRRASREMIDRTEREAAETRKRDEEERRKHDEETKRKAGKSPRNVLAWMKTPRSRARSRISRSKPTKTKHRAAGGGPAVRPPLRARRLALAPKAARPSYGHHCAQRR